MELRNAGLPLFYYFMDPSKRDHDLTILSIFRVQRTHAPTKSKPQELPLIFKIRLKKAADPCFVNYQTMRQKYTQSLLQFYQQKVLLLESGQEEPGDGLDQDCPLSPRAVDSSPHREQSERFLRRRSKRDHREHRRETSKDAPGQQQASENRPVRSCRVRSYFSRDKSLGIPEERLPAKERVPRQSSPAALEAVQPAPPPQQPKNKKSILDYDHLNESEGRQPLISPAVIPSTKIKQEFNPIPSTPVYPLPTHANFKEIEREPYSQEEFKESEESEFILDQRGKEKRKKEKFLRQQEKLSRKKKSRRIKKKTKGSCAQH